MILFKHILARILKNDLDFFSRFIFKILLPKSWKIILIFFSRKSWNENAILKQIKIGRLVRLKNKVPRGRYRPKNNFFFFGRVHQAQASYRPQNVCTWSKIRQGIRFWRQKASKSSKITENYEKPTPNPKNFDQQFFFGVEKSKFANRLKRVFPNFEAKRSHPRGANDRSKLPAVVPMLLRYLTFLPDDCGGFVRYWPFLSIHRSLPIAREAIAQEP